MMGIGFQELLVIALIALIVLGPAKAVDMARSAGKMMGEVKRSFTDLSSTLEQTRWDEPSQSVPREAGKRPDPDRDSDPKAPN